MTSLPCRMKRPIYGSTQGETVDWIAGGEVRTLELRFVFLFLSRRLSHRLGSTPMGLPRSEVSIGL